MDIFLTEETLISGAEGIWIWNVPAALFSTAEFRPYWNGGH
jgi:hypothetical protein